MRAAALLVAVVIAYSYSLSTLIRGIGLQTPLAYLALVPVISLVLAWVRLAREPAPLPIHDRQVDYIIGITLLLVACADRKSTRLNSSHLVISYAVFCLKK